MHQLILFIKSYRVDFIPLLKLLKSIEKFNTDKIPIYLSVNDEDYDFFVKEIKSNVTLFRDSDIHICNFEDKWRYQQIIKTKVYKLNICENYLCIDSDSYFIRPFYISDFMFNSTTPYTIMHESKPFLEMIENIQMNSETIFFKNALEATRSFLGTNGKSWDYGPSPYLWSCKVWKSFNEDYLESKNQSFEDFFNQIDSITTPSETVIYGEYLLKTRIIDIIPVEGFFKVYHFKKQFKLERQFYNEKKLSKIYMGIIFQSNWEKNNQLKRIYNKIKTYFISNNLS